MIPKKGFFWVKMFLSIFCVFLTLTTTYVFSYKYGSFRYNYWALLFLISLTSISFISIILMVNTFAKPNKLLNQRFFNKNTSRVSLLLVNHRLSSSSKIRTIAPVKIKRFQELINKFSVGRNSAEEFRKGSALLLEGFPQDAEIHFRNLLRQFPKDPDALRGFGYCLLDQNKPRDALKIFKKVLKTDNYDNDLLVELLISMGNCSAKVGDYPQALDYYSNAADCDQNHPTLAYNLGLLFEVTTKDKELPRCAFKIATELDPLNPRAWFHYARLSAGKCECWSRRRALLRSVKLDPSLAARILVERDFRVHRRDKKLVRYISAIVDSQLRNAYINKIA